MQCASFPLSFYVAQVAYVMAISQLLSYIPGRQLFLNLIFSRLIRSRKKPQGMKLPLVKV